MKLRLRTHLIVELLLPIIFVDIISMIVGTNLISRSFMRQTQNTIQLNLNSARLIYRNALDMMRGPLLLASFDPTIQNALIGGPIEPVRSQLRRILDESPFDILNLLDPAGNVLVRGLDPSRSGDSLAGDRTIQAVKEGQAIVTGTGVASLEELRNEADEIAQKARIPLVSTAAEPEVGRSETRGLLLKTAVAVKDQGGRLLGILYGARLLNKDERIVDEICQTIFKGETYKGNRIGEATLCLGDVRIATVFAQDGRRAVGTRIAPEIRDQVIDKGKVWVGRAVVVGEWHLTAYEPIRDISGDVVGVLALGILEKEQIDVLRKTLVLFLISILGGALLSLVFSTLAARSVTNSIRKLLHTVQDVASGNLDCQADIRSKVCEIALLGRHINKMTLALKERDLIIKRHTEEKISRSERLAIIGRLSAGVAHQINNPLGGIMLFSDLLLSQAPEQGLERENLERISHEAKRCQKIVQGLLDFARHHEPKFERVDINTVIENTLQLVENQSLFLNISIDRRFSSIPSVDVDVAQMQEVFLNIILNAVEAMESHGTLTITTEVIDEGSDVRISIADTGCGIAEEHIERIFEPFYTTKEEGKGTGLGLSISRGFVEAQGGSIWVTSVAGEGTTFFIRLPSADDLPWRQSEA